LRTNCWSEISGPRNKKTRATPQDPTTESAIHVGLGLGLTHLRSCPVLPCRPGTRASAPLRDEGEEEEEEVDGTEVGSAPDDEARRKGLVTPHPQRIEYYNRRKSPRGCEVKSAQAGCNAMRCNIAEAEVEWRGFLSAGSLTPLLGKRRTTEEASARERGRR